MNKWSNDVQKNQKKSWNRLPRKKLASFHIFANFKILISRPISSLPAGLPSVNNKNLNNKNYKLTFIFLNSTHLTQLFASHQIRNTPLSYAPKWTSNTVKIYKIHEIEKQRTYYSVIKLCYMFINLFIKVGMAAIVNKLKRIKFVLKRRD